MESVDKALLRKLEEARALIESRLGELSASLSNLGLSDVVSYINSGGKRLRGFLTLLTCETLGCKADDAIDIAIAIELVHAASLTLDDIIDQDRERRGMPAAWVLYGVGKTAMVSLFLVPLALKIIERFGRAALSYSVSAWEEIVRGELLDAYASVKGPLVSYVDLARLKTGPLFALAVALPFIAASRADVAEEAYNLGDLIGLTYQIADDIVDYISYLRGLRPELDTGERLFREWAMNELGANSDDEVVSKALDYLREKVTDVSKKADELFTGYGQRELMKEVPRFLANMMLAQQGLSL